MPIYDYECTCCGHQFEKKGSYKELEQIDCNVLKHKLDCPMCGYTDWVRKIVSKSDFQLKGNGWAKDSYGLKEKK